MNFKRKKTQPEKLVKWESPKALQSKSKEIQAEIIPYKHFPNKKFCKILKGDHQFAIKQVRIYYWSKVPRASVDLLCACGKKDWDYKDAEALSKEEAELFFMQAVSHRRSKEIQRP